MADILPYKVNVSDDKIENLKRKIAEAEFPDEVEDAEPWSRGTPLSELQDLVHHWQHNYDWRIHEAKINELPQYTTKINVDKFGTFDVHFVHQPSPVKNAIPLLFCHGWPGSFMEVTKLLPKLVDGGMDHPSFHVVAPSMLDFGFSSRTGKADFQYEEHAEVYHKLMTKLGYSQYVVQGGDLGYFVARFLAMGYPNSVKAHHVNMCHPPELTATSNPALWAEFQLSPLTDYEKAGLARSRWFRDEGFGYNLLQCTRPQTAGYAIAANPVALLAWIYEKLHDWTDNYPWTKDEALTWISLYYFSKPGAAASLRVYYEMSHRQTRSSSHKEAYLEVQKYVDVPLGYSRFPREIVLLPKVWTKAMGPLVFLKEHPAGGHFAAWEKPDELAGDIRQMFGRGGGAYGVVDGKDGY